MIRTTGGVHTRRHKPNTCAECANRTATTNRVHCQQCRDAYVEAIRRRRAAEWRLQPLESLT